MPHGGALISSALLYDSISSAHPHVQCTPHGAYAWTRLWNQCFEKTRYPGRCFSDATGCARAPPRIHSQEHGSSGNQDDRWCVSRARPCIASLPAHSRHDVCCRPRGAIATVHAHARTQALAPERIFQRGRVPGRPGPQVCVVSVRSVSKRHGGALISSAHLHVRPIGVHRTCR